MAVRDLMTFDYIPAPRTIRKGVRKLEPGSRFDWQPGTGEPSDRTVLEPAAGRRHACAHLTRRSSKSCWSDPSRGRW